MTKVTSPLSAFLYCVNIAGVQRIFSTPLMLASLLLLQTGCTLPVVSEPLAYEGILSSTWNILPVSGIFELTVVCSSRRISD